MEIPYFPAYEIQTHNSDTESVANYSHVVRLSFRVKDEDLEGVLRTLGTRLNEWPDMQIGQHRELTND